jgi:hypothetical protein
MCVYVCMECFSCTIYVFFKIVWLIPHPAVILTNFGSMECNVCIMYTVFMNWIHTWKCILFEQVKWALIKFCSWTKQSQDHKNHTHKPTLNRLQTLPSAIQSFTVTKHFTEIYKTCSCIEGHDHSHGIMTYYILVSLTTSLPNQCLIYRCCHNLTLHLSGRTILIIIGYRSIVHPQIAETDGLQIWQLALNISRVGQVTTLHHKN